ncbi:dnaJ homolog subfamily C member 10-like isoform X2 [Artemia franciscana]
MRTIHACFLLVQLCAPILAVSYYDVLGIRRDSTDQEIRRAFKKLALMLHPDKNKNDPEAQDKFLKMKQAYEVLKDTDLRRKYDLYGEEGLDKRPSNNNYHSWSYYEKSFGLYDDDEEVVVLTSADFFQSVTSSDDYWFVNFYSPGCSHCHTIAPIWREFAVRMDGVIRVGAVNCQEYWDICTNNGIRSYPSLIFYPSGQQYSGDRTVEDLEDFILSALPRLVIQVNSKEQFSEDEDETMYLLFFCQDRDDEDCPSDRTKYKMAILLDGLVRVGLVYCSVSKELCRSIGIESGTAFFPTKIFSAKNVQRISSLNFRDISNEVYDLLPKPRILSSEDLEAEIKLLEEDEEVPSLFLKFVGGNLVTSEDRSFNRLPALLKEMKHVSLNCSHNTDFCKEYGIDKFPSFGVFKTGGIFESIWGEDNLQDVVAFAKAALNSPNLITLTPKLLHEIISGEVPWVIDFFAPWCPPCKRVLPVLREASNLVSDVKFGTLDCVKFSAICSDMGIRSYPSMILFRGSQRYQYAGDHSATRIVEFIEDTLNPAAIQLTLESFDNFISLKPVTDIWIIDFYASWCGPCQHLKPQWGKLAKTLVPLNTFVHVGEVDCVREVHLCSREGINSYPTIRLYPQGYFGKSSFIPYTSYQRDLHSLLNWSVKTIPSLVLNLNEDSFYRSTNSVEPWLIEFYLPWCQPCQVFAPRYEIIAKVFEGVLKAGKINCEYYGHICRQAGVRSYPAVKLYVGSHKRGHFIEEDNHLSIIEEIREYLSSETPYTLHDEL